MISISLPGPQEPPKGKANKQLYLLWKGRAFQLDWGLPGGWGWGAELGVLPLPALSGCLFWAFLEPTCVRIREIIYLAYLDGRPFLPIRFLLCFRLPRLYPPHFCPHLSSPAPRGSHGRTFPGRSSGTS